MAIKALEQQPCDDKVPITINIKGCQYLEEKYYEWIEENSVKDCPMSVIEFLDLNGLLQKPTIKNKGNTIQVPRFNMTKKDNFKGE